MIKLDRAGKRFRKEWIFRGVDLVIQPGDRLAVLGGNGSGKSTFLQMTAGFLIPSEGEISWHLKGGRMDPELVWQYVSLSSPYLQLPDDLTVEETILHSAQFKPLLSGFTAPLVLETAMLQPYREKRVRELSSGLRQRLKLALAILSDTPLLLLDEPVSNLDKPAITWYSGMIERFAGNRTVIVCSNEIASEYSFCDYALTLPGMQRSQILR